MPSVKNSLKPVTDDICQSNDLFTTVRIQTGTFCFYDNEDRFNFKINFKWQIE